MINRRAGPILGETLVDTFSMLRCAIDCFWTDFFVLVAAFDAAVTVDVAVDVHNVMK